jgi:hypothetical protein
MNPCPIVAGFTFLVATAAGQPPTSAPAEGKLLSVSCFVRIQCDGGLIPATSSRAMEALLARLAEEAAASGTDAGIASAEVKLTAAGAAPRLPRDEERPPALEGESLFLGSIRVGPVAAASAGEFASRLTHDLELAFEQMRASQKHLLTIRVKRAEERVMELRARIAALQERRAKRMSKAGRSDLSRDSILDLARGLERERQDNTLKTDRLTVRQEAIQQVVARMAAETKDPARLKDDPVVQAYRQRLQAVERKLEGIKARNRQGLESHTEVDKAEVELAEVKADLEVKLREMADPSMIKTLATLNQELATLSVDLAEARSRVPQLQQRSEEISRLLVEADQYELEVGIPLNQLKATLEAAERQLEAARDRLVEASELPPVILVR